MSATLRLAPGAKENPLPGGEREHGESEIARDLHESELRVQADRRRVARIGEEPHLVRSLAEPLHPQRSETPTDTPAAVTVQYVHSHQVPTIRRYLGKGQRRSDEERDPRHSDHPTRIERRPNHAVVEASCELPPVNAGTALSAHLATFSGDRSGHVYFNLAQRAQLYARDRLGRAGTDRYRT